MNAKMKTFFFSVLSCSIFKPDVMRATICSQNTYVHVLCSVCVCVCVCVYTVFCIYSHFIVVGIWMITFFGLGTLKVLVLFFCM